MKAALELEPVVGSTTACAMLSLPRATFYRDRAPMLGPHRPKRSPRALAPHERADVLCTLHQARFADLPPAAVYATLLDEGRYLCSERTMYRVLATCDEVRERRDQRKHPVRAAPRLVARAPNEVWCWDISKLRGPTKGHFFFLYTVIDLFSRRIVGWMVARTESGALAEAFFEHVCRREGVPHTVHSDRGSPMKSRPLALLFDDLGVAGSFSRPRTSNDNAFMESHYKTLKTRPDFPDRFESLEHARAHCKDFFAWYNGDHKHSSLGLLTPDDVHYGRVTERITQRHAVLEQAFALHPERFPLGSPTPAMPAKEVWINQPNEQQQLDLQQVH